MKKLLFLALALVLCVSMCACVEDNNGAENTGESSGESNVTEKHEHDWDVVTTAPTCLAGGYDTKTCKTCGEVETCNQTEIGEHAYSTAPDTDKDCHWYKCTVCDQTTEKEEHIPSSAGACTVCNASVSPTEGIIYDTSADKTYAEVIGYTGTKKNILIASEYNGLLVKSIYKEAFEYSTITSVVIPDSVTYIGERAFEGCTKIKSVTIPDSVTVIDSYAFLRCESLASINIPDSVTYIGSLAFSACNNSLYKEYELGKYVGNESNPYAALVEITNKNLSTYKIHEKTRIIAGYTFADCSRLGNITIPDGVISIGDLAFYGCSSLTSITIPNSVASIEKEAFRFCNNLTDIYYTGTKTQWDKISIASDNYSLDDATIHYNHVVQN